MHKYGIVSTTSITSKLINDLRKARDETICIDSIDINKLKKFVEE